MRTRLILTPFLLLLSYYFYGQSEKLNQFDSSGKKEGKWAVYLDAKWNKVDSSKAIFFRYTWFDHGVNIHPMGAGGGKNSKMESPVEISKHTGGAKLLDGEYKWYDGKWKLKYIHIFMKGEYVLYKEYFSSGELRTFFDYTKGCEGQTHSWVMYLYDKKGNLLMTSFTCKDKKGMWPVMRGGYQSAFAITV